MTMFFRSAPARPPRPGPARRHGRAALAVAVLAAGLAAAAIPAVPAAAAVNWAVTATINVGAAPAGVAVDPLTRTVYVANGGSNTVSVISETTNTVTATIPVGTNPVGLDVDPNTDSVYVANNGSGTVSVISEATDAVTATIPVGPLPQGVSVNPPAGIVYVAFSGDALIGGFLRAGVSVISDATNTVTGTIAEPGNNQCQRGGASPVAADPPKGLAYVGNFFGSPCNLVWAIAGSFPTAPVTAPNTFGCATDGLAVDPGLNTVYAALEGCPDLAVINEENPSPPGSLTTTIPLDGGASSVGVDSSTHTVYVTTPSLTNGHVQVIDGTTGTVTQSVPVGLYPAGVGVDSSTHTAYVTNADSNTVSVIGIDNDLAIAQPANITTDATGPSGATVSYPAPAVTDPDDASPPAAACSQPSGHLFPIGTTTVTCTATDLGDGNSPVTTSFTITVKPVPCPSGTKANFRWHYTANGNAGGWSGTATQACPGSISMGPQAMDGNLQVTPGTTLQAGYDFTLPGNKNTLHMTVSAAQVTFTVACVSGATPSQPTLTVNLTNQSYQITNDQWYPSGDQSSPQVYQGSAPVPDLCGGGKISLAKGGTFIATIS